MHINELDKKQIEMDYENPGINSDFKISISQIKHFNEIDEKSNHKDVINTSDEDVSDVVSDIRDAPDLSRPRRKLRISLKNIEQNIMMSL